jgi:hypothetical protein
MIHPSLAAADLRRPNAIPVALRQAYNRFWRETDIRWNREVR